MKVEYLISLAFLTAYSLFGISHGQYYYGYNYRPKSYLGFRRVSSRPNPNRYFSATSNYGLSPGWYRSRQEYWKAHKKMYGYPDGMETTTMMSTTESPSLTTTPYPTQDGMEVVSSDQSYPSTMQSAVPQEVQQPYIPGYPESSVTQTQPVTQDLSQSSQSSSSSVMSIPLSPATQDVTSTVANPAPIQSPSVESMQLQTTASSLQTQQFGAKLPQPQSHLLPSSSSGSKLVANAEFKERNSSRICNPGPPLRPNPRLKNCLVIGDSIALGYLKPVKFLLSNKCQVQHAPFARGSGAMDSRHGLKCLPLLLKTTAMEPTSYDAILFNFGMHDIDYSKRFPEEHVPFDEYKDNILKLKESFLKTGAKVAFALTTPFPSDKTRNDRIEKFNAEAVRIMEGGQRIPVVDLYDLVVKKCGKPTYDSCSIMKGPRDVHYNEEGNQLLGVRVAATFATLLDQEPQKKRPPARKAIVRRYFEQGGYSDYYVPDDAITCPDAVTRCPLGSTCCESLISLTGYGCCMIPNAVNCPDNWHCCPNGSTCSPTCTVRECKCITYTTTGNGTTISHESKASSKYLAEINSLNSGGTGDRLGKNFKPITDPLLRVLKKLANAHKTRKHHPKKNYQMLTNKLLDSKGKLQFKNVKHSKWRTRKTKHKTTVNRFETKQHSINVELGHLIEHHHKHIYKNLKKLLKKGMSKTKHRHIKDKSTPRKLAKPVIRQKAKSHQRKHGKVLKKKQHNDSSRHNFESHHNHSRHLHEKGKVIQSDGEDENSKSHVDHEHQRNHSIANESLRNKPNHSAANRSLHRLANHNQSFKYEFVADRNNHNSRVTVLKSNNESQGMKDVSGKRQRPLDQHHRFREEHIYSDNESGSGEGIGLSDMGSTSLDGEYVSGSGMGDNDSMPISPSLDKDLKSSGHVPKHSTIQSSKSVQNISDEVKHSSASGSETPLLNVLSSSQGESNAMHDSFDDLNPSGDGHVIPEPTEGSDITSASGESLDQTLGESVDNNDDHGGFDLMSSALMENDGANNDVIEEDQSAGKRQDVASSNDGKYSQLADTIKKTTIQVKEDKSRSSLTAGEQGSDVNEDDDIRGKHDKTTGSIADHGMGRPPVEDKERVEVDFDDSDNLIGLDSILEDNSGYSNETQSEAPAKTWSSITPSKNQDDAQNEIPMPSDSENGLMNELPLESLASDYPNDTQASGRSTIKVLKTDLVENPVEDLASRNSSVETAITRSKPTLVENVVEGSASENLSLETTITTQRPTLVENPKENLSIKSPMETPKNLVEGSENISSVAIAPSPKSEQLSETLQRNDNAIMHVNPTYTKHNHAVLENKQSKGVDTTKLKDGDIQRSNLNKKKQPKNATSKTFARKPPKILKDDNVKNRRKMIHEKREKQNESISYRIESKSASSFEGNENPKETAISSIHVVTKTKGMRKYRNRKKTPQQTKEKKHSINSKDSAITGERDDINNENKDDDQTSVAGEENGREMLESYLATT